MTQNIYYNIKEPRYPIAQVVKGIERCTWDLGPDFQRDFIWGAEKQSSLIESVILGIPLPTHYIHNTSKDVKIVVDGRQRLTTFFKFLKGDLTLRLTSQSELAYLDGKKYGDLELRLQERIDDFQLNFCEIPDSVQERNLMDIFKRLNSGVPLSKQQMRDALFCGPATLSIRKMASHPLFVEVTDGGLLTPAKKQEQEDRAWVNRFYAFSWIPWDQYRDLDSWLERALKELNEIPEALPGIEEEFLRSLRNHEVIFGQNSFRRPKRDAKSKLNVSIFEVTSHFLRNVDERRAREKKSQFQKAFFDLFKIEEFETAIGGGSSNSYVRVHPKFKMVGKITNEIFGGK